MLILGTDANGLLSSLPSLGGPFAPNGEGASVD